MLLEEDGWIDWDLILRSVLSIVEIFDLVKSYEEFLKRPSARRSSTSLCTLITLVERRVSIDSSLLAHLIIGFLIFISFFSRAIRLQIFGAYL